MIPQEQLVRKDLFEMPAPLFEKARQNSKRSNALGAGIICGELW